MNLTQEAIKEIKKSQGATLPIIIRDLIKDESSNRLRMQNLWSEYTGGVQIKSTYIPDNPARPAERLAHDYRGIIVQQQVSYLVGNPIQFTLSEGAATDYVVATELLEKFLKVNYYEKLISELETYLAVCGQGAILLYYINKSDYLGNNNVEVIAKTIKPFEQIVINDSTTDEPQVGMIYYQVEVINGQNRSYRTKVEFYDNINVYYFIEDAGGNYIPDNTYGDTFQPHGFTEMPLIPFYNNSLKMGAFEKVKVLIDGYDSLISSALSDYRAYAMAYLIYYGILPDAEQIDLARKTGAFYVPLSTDGNDNSRIEFLTKEMNTQNLKELADRLNNDIFKFASAIDYSDESFGGNQSGVARRYKLIPLESKAMESERWLKFGLQQMFKVISTFWAQLTGIKVDPTGIEMTLTRNLPLDYTVADLIALKAANIISTETAINSLPFIDDTEKELKRLEEQGVDTNDTENDSVPEPIPLLPTQEPALGSE